MSTFDKLKDIVQEQLVVNPDEIKMESHITDDLGADSLDKVELVMAVEEDFDIEFKDEEIAEIETVAQFIELIDQKLA